MILATSPYTLLTTKPQKRLISTAHPERLYILPHGNITSPALVCVVTYTDGTEEEHDLIASGSMTANYGEVRDYDISYAKRDYNNLNPAKTIKKFIIRVDSADYTDGSGDYIECYPYTPSSDQVKAIYYHNSMGGLDSLICEGDQMKSLQFSGVQSAIPLESVYDGQTHQFKWLDPTFRTTENVNTTPRPGKEIFALKDLFIHKRAYEYKTVTGGFLMVPIIPDQDSLQLPSERTNLKKLSFSYRYAVQQRAIDRVS